MDKKYQIFISSTFKDLIEQRNEVVKVVLRLSQLPVGMEIFNAASATPWDVITSHIDNSDYYVLILAHRYGSEDPVTEIGYTEKEYDYALSKGIPCLAFVIKDGVQWNPELMEQKPGPKKKLAAFKKKIHVHHVSYWTSTEDLASQVLLALVDETRNNPGIGWVRANAITSSPSVAEELSRLSKENSELKIQLANTDNKQDEYTELIDILTASRATLVAEDGEISFTLNDLFLATCQAQNSPYVSNVGAKLVTLKGREGAKVKEARILNEKGTELSSLGLLSKESTHSGNLWYLTERGTKLYAKLRYMLAN
ncbi:MAG: DUF4062 domain-containing protein [Janthinobacterium lividum]